MLEPNTLQVSFTNYSKPWDLVFSSLPVTPGLWDEIVIRPSEHLAQNGSEILKVDQNGWLRVIDQPSGNFDLVWWARGPFPLPNGHLSLSPDYGVGFALRVETHLQVFNAGWGPTWRYYFGQRSREWFAGMEYPSSLLGPFESETIDETKFGVRARVDSERQGNSLKLDVTFSPES